MAVSGEKRWPRMGRNRWPLTQKQPVCGDALQPHQLRHAHAIEMAHEGIPLVVIPRELGHANLGIT